MRFLFLKNSYYSIETIGHGSATSQAPRVKSGTSTEFPLFSTLSSLKGIKLHQEAAS